MTVLQGYGTTETGTGSCTTLDDHGLGTVGRPPAGIEMRLADDGEVQFRGPTLFKGYWHDAAATAAAFTDDGWYRTGDVGHFDPAGRLILSGRSRDMIVLPNGFNVYPEDIENALRIAGLRDSVVVETRPGRIEAIVLAGAAGGPARQRNADAGNDARCGARIDAMVKAANARLGPNQRIAAWRLWPEEDFPRTHTLKIKRAPDPRLGDRGHRAIRSVGQQPGESRSQRPGRPSPPTGKPTPTVSSACWISGADGSWAAPGQPVVEDHRRADLAQDLDRALRRLDPAGTGLQVVLLLGSGRRRRR